MNEEINKPERTGASKDEKAQERDSKISETKGLEKEISDFRQTRDAIVDEIMKVVNDQVRAANYDIVFDRSGFSVNNIVPVLLYSRDNYDFSDSVITKLNSSRPAATAIPSVSQKPTASTNTPATTVRPAGELGKKPH